MPIGKRIAPAIRRPHFAADIDTIIWVNQAATNTPTNAIVASAPALLEIAAHVLEGEALAKRKRYDDAIAKLERAVRLEDGLMF